MRQSYSYVVVVFIEDTGSVKSFATIDNVLYA